MTLFAQLISTLTWDVAFSTPHAVMSACYRSLHASTGPYTRLLPLTRGPMSIISILQASSLVHSGSLFGRVYFASPPSAFLGCSSAQASISLSPPVVMTLVVAVRARAAPGNRPDPHPHKRCGAGRLRGQHVYLRVRYLSITLSINNHAVPLADRGGGIRIRDSTRTCTKANLRRRRPCTLRAVRRDSSISARRRCGGVVSWYAHCVPVDSLSARDTTS